MSELSYAQQRDIIERLQEAFEYDPERTYPTDTVTEVVDSWLPVYYSDIVEQWNEAGCPDPDETMPEQLERDKHSIHYLMTLGLWEVARDFAIGAIWSNETGEANTHAEALENLKENYFKTDAELGAEIVGRKLAQIFK
jgi:hypothetical protein